MPAGATPVPRGWDVGAGPVRASRGDVGPWAPSWAPPRAAGAPQPAPRPHAPTAKGRDSGHTGSVAGVKLGTKHNERTFVSEHSAAGSTPAAEGPGNGLALTDSIYNRLLKERIIWLGSEVRDDNANAICAQMLLLAAEDPERDIYLYINSPGGSVTAGMAIYDTMQYVQPDVVTVATGLAASMGQFLLSAGARGKRYITPHARVLMHQPSGGAGGSATDIRINADLIIAMKHELAQITAADTGHTVEEILADSDRDHWFSATEALEYGFVDHIVSSSREIGQQAQSNGEN